MFLMPIIAETMLLVAVCVTFISFNRSILLLFSCLSISDTMLSVVITFVAPEEFSYMILFRGDVNNLV